MESFYLTGLSIAAEQGIAPTQNWSGLLIPAIVILLIILFVFFMNTFLQVYWKKREIGEEWHELEALFKKYEFSPEETTFLRSKLRKLGYTHPTAVLRKETEFSKFHKRVLRRPNHHAEYLLALIRKKVFEQKKHSPAVKKPVKSAVRKAP